MERGDLFFFHGWWCASYVSSLVICVAWLMSHDLPSLLLALGSSYAALSFNFNLSISFFFFFSFFSGKWGSLPMNGQVSCEGPMGKTSLFDMEALTAIKPETMFRKDMDFSQVKVTIVVVLLHYCVSVCDLNVGGESHSRTLCRWFLFLELVCTKLFPSVLKTIF